MRADLFYADPARCFDHCLRTLLARRRPAATTTSSTSSRCSCRRPRPPVTELSLTTVVIFGTGDFARIAERLPRRSTARTRSWRSPSTATTSTATSSAGCRSCPSRSSASATRPTSSRCSSRSASRRSTRRAREIYERVQGARLRADQLRQLEGDVLGRRADRRELLHLRGERGPAVVRIGNDVVLWSGNHIGHDSTIGDHCFIASHVVVSGNVHDRRLLLPRRQRDVPRRRSPSRRAA